MEGILTCVALPGVGGFTNHALVMAIWNPPFKPSGLTVTPANEGSKNGPTTLL